MGHCRDSDHPRFGVLHALQAQPCRQLMLLHVLAQTLLRVPVRVQITHPSIPLLARPCPWLACPVAPCADLNPWQHEVALQPPASRKHLRSPPTKRACQDSIISPAFACITNSHTSPTTPQSSPLSSPPTQHLHPTCSPHHKPPWPRLSLTHTAIAMCQPVPLSSPLSLSHPHAHVNRCRRVQSSTQSRRWLSCCSARPPRRPSCTSPTGCSLKTAPCSSRLGGCPPSSSPAPSRRSRCSGSAPTLPCRCVGCVGGCVCCQEERRICRLIGASPSSPHCVVICLIDWHESLCRS